MILGTQAVVAAADDGGDICRPAAFKGRVWNNVFWQELEPPAFLAVIGHIFSSEVWIVQDRLLSFFNNSLTVSKRAGRFFLDNVPDNLQIDAKVFMNQKVSEIFYIMSFNRLIILFNGDRDLANGFPNDFELRITAE